MTGRPKAGFGTGLIKDFAFLQLRMCCELIALANLVAHGDTIPETQTTKMQGSWSSDFIMNRLEALQPGFYPRPVRRQDVSPGAHHMAEFQGDYLTKADLIELVHASGSALHRGSLKSLNSEQQAEGDMLKQLVTWTNKMVMLLQEHCVIFSDLSVYYVVLKSADQGGRCVVTLAAVQNQPGS